MKVKHRKKLFKRSGFKTQAVLPGKIHWVSQTGGKNAYIGSCMPFELTSSRPGRYDLCIHRVEYANRNRRSPLSAQVILHMPGGATQEFTSSASIAGPVLAVQAWPRRAAHLQQYAAGNTKAVHDIIASAAGTSVVLTDAAISTAIGANRVVLMYLPADKQWVCSACGALFNSPHELARHDGIQRLASRPRLLKPNAMPGPLFKVPTFSESDSWKVKAIRAINQGDVEAAIKLAPTCKNDLFAQKLKEKLAKLG